MNALLSEASRLTYLNLKSETTAPDEFTALLRFPNHLHSNLHFFAQNGWSKWLLLQEGNPSPTAKMESLRSLHTGNCSLIPADSLSHHSFPNLVALSVYPTKENGVQFIAALSQLPQLRALSTWSECETFELDAIPRHCPLLEHLDVYCCSSEHTKEVLSTAGRMKRLKSRNIGGGVVSETWADMQPHLHEVIDRGRLEFLCLPHGAWISAEDALRLLEQCKVCPL